MKKLYTLISLVCILNILAMLGLAGYLFGTGRLDKSKAQVITDMLRTEGSPVGFRTKVYDLMNPEPATQPATRNAAASGADLVKEDVPATAIERNDYVRRSIEAERLRLENEAQELRNQQDMLANMQAAHAASVEKTEAKRKSFEEQVAAASKQKEQEAFEKMKALIEELKPKQIKDLFVTMTPLDASRYMAALEPERAAKVLTEFKSPEEKSHLGAVLDQMRGTAPASGTGAATGNGAALSALPAVKAGS